MNTPKTLYSKILLIIFLGVILFSNLTTWRIYGNIYGFNVLIILFVAFVVLAIFDFRIFYGLKENQNIYKPLLIFFAWWFFRSLFSMNDPLFYNTEFWQWIILFILFTNYISQDIHIGYKALFAYLLSALVILFIYYFNGNVWYAHGRLSIFEGTNPNTIGPIASNAILIILFFVLEDVLKWKWKRFLLLLAIPGLFEIIIETGSRGALIYLMLGLILFLMLSKIKLHWKIIAAVVSLIVGVVVFSNLFVSEVFQNRWMNVDVSELGGRRTIWTLSFKLFLEKPIVGYGDGKFWGVLGRTYSKNVDPHNIYLVTLVTSGLIGFFLFMVFLFRILKITILNIKFQKSIICFVLYIVCLASFFKEGSAINDINSWIRLAIIVGLSTALSKVNVKQNL